MRRIKKTKQSGPRLPDGCGREYSRKDFAEMVKGGANAPRSTRSSSSGSPTACSCSLCCGGGRTRPPSLYRFWVWRPLDFGPDTSAETHFPSGEAGTGKRTKRPPNPTLMALRRSVSCSRLLKQLLQLHMLQNSPFAKQSQYLRDGKDLVLVRIPGQEFDFIWS